MNLNVIESAWKAHTLFAEWLVGRVDPEVIVDLGVDLGYSTFVFARYCSGHVYGIDLSDKIDEAEGYRKRLNLRNVTLLKMTFEEALKDWKESIDILHIDGTHDDVQSMKDFNDWSPFLSPRGVVLFHDTMSYDWGVGKTFKEIDWPKYEMRVEHGLGILSRDTELIEEIAKWNY